mmetsp:Transcript_28115/g.32205  ORF Transcript_28115/g.32205 Transcript_28115/m.32205 type:complete len:415 (+) Transcript_28115:46-1290(+)
MFAFSSLLLLLPAAATSFFLTRSSQGRHISNSNSNSNHVQRVRISGGTNKIYGAAVESSYKQGKIVYLAFNALADQSNEHNLNVKVNVNVLNKESELSCQISQVLKEKQKELLSDKSKLLQQHPQSIVAADNEIMRTLSSSSLSNEQMVREALLSARLPLPFLNRTELGPSTIEGAGRGLFATENIAKGEVITLYPGDALLSELPSDTSSDGDDDYDYDSCDDDDSYDDTEEEDYDYDCDAEEEEEYIDEVVLWGAHVSNNNRLDDDTVFDGCEVQSIPPLTAYAVSVDDYYSVMGHPTLDDNPAYYGHFANDGAGHLALEKPNSQIIIEAALELGLVVDTDTDTNKTEDGEIMGVEERIATYVMKSLEVSNAIHEALDEGGGGLHMATVATRDVEKGEEILVTYGPDYWLEHG